jgi:hypothetical protein
MADKRIVWRITPGSSGLQRAWSLERVEKHPGGESRTGFGFFKTLKAAKAMVAHMKRKPIELE